MKYSSITYLVATASLLLQGPVEVAAQIDVAIKVLSSEGHFPRSTEIVFFNDELQLASFPTEWTGIACIDCNSESSVDFMEPYPFGYSMNCNDQGWILADDSQLTYSTVGMPDKLEIHHCWDECCRSASLEVSRFINGQVIAIDTVNYSGNLCGWVSLSLSPVSIQEGCTDVMACNFLTDALIDDGTCEYGCIYCGPGTTWSFDCSCCRPHSNICGSGSYWSELYQMCISQQQCSGDLNWDNVVGSTDLLILLSGFGLACENPEYLPPCSQGAYFQGHLYSTIEIDGKCWFKENLRATKYANDEPITHAQGWDEWADSHSSLEGAFAIFNADSNFMNLHGLLYNGHAVADERGLCPSGWHVANNDDFISLLLATGTTNVCFACWNDGSGLALKSNPSDIPPWNGYNTFGWNGTRSGVRTGAWYTTSTWFWSSSPPHFNGMYNWRLTENAIDTDKVFWGADPASVGSYVRCVRD